MPQMPLLLLDLCSKLFPCISHTGDFRRVLSSSLSAVQASESSCDTFLILTVDNVTFCSFQSMPEAKALRVPPLWLCSFFLYFCLPRDLQLSCQHFNH